MKEIDKLGVRKDGSPYSEEECDVIIQQLTELLDGELPNDEQKKVIEKIDSCEYCLEQYKIQKSFKELIKVGFNNILVSNKLISSIKNSIKKFKTFNF